MAKTASSSTISAEKQNSQVQRTFKSEMSIESPLSTGCRTRPTLGLVMIALIGGTASVDYYF
jgi:hypothetical protein